MGIKIIIEKNANEVAEKAAKLVLNEITEKPALALGLPTGKTMIPFYKKLIKNAKKRKISLANIKTFDLDEYYKIGKDNKNSLFHFMKKNFFSKIDIKKGNINFLNGSAENYKKECKSYERKMRKIGIDLMILGIGRNGHVAFNEPGSSFQSKTRLVKLSESTRRANSVFFQSEKKVPYHALTIGLDTIMGAKKIILLATGKNKRNAVKKALFGKISTVVPASILREHKNVAFIVDKSAVQQDLNK